MEINSVDLSGCCWTQRKHADGCSLCLSFAVQIYISTVVHSLCVCVRLNLLYMGHAVLCVLLKTMNLNLSSFLSSPFLSKTFFQSNFLIEDIKWTSSMQTELLHQKSRQSHAPILSALRLWCSPDGQEPNHLPCSPFTYCKATCFSFKPHDLLRLHLMSAQFWKLWGAILVWMGRNGDFWMGWYRHPGSPWSTQCAMLACATLVHCAEVDPGST